MTGKSVVAILATLVSITFAIQPALVRATNVSWFSVPVSLPNDASPPFPTARDLLLNGLALHGGNPIATGSRSNNAAGVELKSCFEAGDAIVVDPNQTTNRIWRGVLNLSNPFYTNLLGNRIYDTVLVVGNGQKVSLRGLSCSVIDTGGVMDNNTSLITNDMSVSRIGIIRGSQGGLYDNDAQVLTSGSGDMQVDAILWIGARAAVSVTSQTGIDAFNAYIGTGKTIRFVYSYTGTNNSGTYTEKYERDAYLFQQGQIPARCQGMEIFLMSGGELFSLVNFSEADTFTVWTGRNLLIPLGLQTTIATTGFSVMIPFTYNGTNDQGYVHCVLNTP